MPIIIAPITATVNMMFWYHVFTGHLHK